MSEKDKITPKQLNETIALVKDTIDGIKGSIRYIEKFEYNIGYIEYTVQVLRREKARLEEQLEIFTNTDIDIIKQTVYSKDFANLIENTLYGSKEEMVKK